MGDTRLGSGARGSRLLERVHSTSAITRSPSRSRPVIRLAASDLGVRVPGVVEVDGHPAAELAGQVALPPVEVVGADAANGHTGLRLEAVEGRATTIRDRGPPSGSAASASVVRSRWGEACSRLSGSRYGSNSATPRLATSRSSRWSSWLGTWRQVRRRGSSGQRSHAPTILAASVGLQVEQVVPHPPVDAGAFRAADAGRVDRGLEVAIVARGRRGRDTRRLLTGT